MTDRKRRVVWKRTNAVLPDGLLEACASRLFLALDDHDEVDLHLLLPPQLGRRGCDGQYRTLVVRHTATVQPPVLPSHRERVVTPQLGRRGGYHVVVSVMEDTLASGRLEAIRLGRGIGAEGREDDRVLVRCAR